MSNFIVYGYQDQEKPTMWYIGKTNRRIDKRDSEHRRRKESIFDNHYKKYPHRFSLHILKNCQSREEATAWEIVMIGQFDSMWPNGYNLTTGGEGGFVVSDLTREKQSEMRIGKYGGDKHPMWGKHQSKEAKEKNRISNLGIHAGDNHPMFRKHPPDETRERMVLAKLKRTDEFRRDMWKRISNTKIKNRVSVGEKNPRAKLTESQVTELRNLFNNGISQGKLSKIFNIGKTTVGHIVHGRSWGYLLERNND